MAAQKLGFKPPFIAIDSFRLLTAPSNLAPQRCGRNNSIESAGFADPCSMTFQSHNTRRSRRPVNRIKEINGFITQNTGAEVVFGLFWPVRARKRDSSNSFCTGVFSDLRVLDRLLTAPLSAVPHKTRYPTTSPVAQVVESKTANAWR